MNADGTGQTRLTDNPADDVDPTWSPDGSKIAFYSNRDGDYEIYVMSAGGTGVTKLTDNTAGDGDPDWSPDGTRIVFHSDRDGDLEIYVMNADGTNQTRLTHNSATDSDPTWSPYGTRIAFQSARDGNWEVYVMNADGSDQTNLSNNTAGEQYPSWSPDGSRLAFLSSRDGADEIYVMNADGSGQVRLTNNTAGDGHPVWSPDGGRIAFHSDRDGNWEIYAMAADGTNQTRLTDNVLPDWWPAWSRSAPPAAGGALRFDGVSAYAGVVAPVWNLYGDSSYTVELWVRGESWGNPNQHIIGIGDTSSANASLGLVYGGPDWVTQVHPDQPIGLYVCHLGNDWGTGFLPVADTWYHVSVTYDGSTERLYVNGMLYALGGYSGFTLDPAPLIIGSQAWVQPALPFDGELDELRIWNYARSAEQIAASYDHVLTGAEPGLVAYYRFDEGTGQWAQDRTALGNHAQLGATAGTDDTDPEWVTSTAPITY